MFCHPNGGALYGSYVAVFFFLFFLLLLLHSLIWSATQYRYLAFRSICLMTQMDSCYFSSSLTMQRCMAPSKSDHKGYSMGVGDFLQSDGFLIEQPMTYYYVEISSIIDRANIEFMIHAFV